MASFRSLKEIAMIVEKRGRLGQFLLLGGLYLAMSSACLGQTATVRKLQDGSIEFKCEDGRRIVKKPPPDNSEYVFFPDGTEKIEMPSLGDKDAATQLFQLPAPDLLKKAVERCKQSD